MAKLKEMGRQIVNATLRDYKKSNVMIKVCVKKDIWM